MAYSNAYAPRQPPENAYGAALLQKPAKSPFVSDHGYRVHCGTICNALLLPWALFVIVFSVMSLSIRREHNGFAWLLVTACLIVVGIIGLITYSGYATNTPHDMNMRRIHNREIYPFMFVTSLFWWFYAVIDGQLVFAEFQLYYDNVDLATYEGIDPARSMGETLMDAGRVLFTPNTMLDLSMATSFQHDAMNCIVPIVSGNASLGNYDFWAADMECCGVQKDFTCKNWDNRKVKGGIRILDENQQAYYKLAVQQAEAAYHIQSIHPLFFRWAADPIGEINQLRANGLKRYVFGILLAFGLQLGALMIAAIILVKA